MTVMSEKEAQASGNRQPQASRGHEHGKLLGRVSAVSLQERDAIVLTMSKPNFSCLKGTHKSPDPSQIQPSF